MRILFFLVFLSLSALGADPKFPVNDIPAELREGMYAVIRKRSSTFTIVDRAHSRHHTYTAITILNSKARSYAYLSVWYDKLRKIKTLKATLYDANGNVVKKLKPSDIVDQSSISGISLYEDNREKLIDFRHTVYPYTVEFEYEIEMNYLYSIPEFTLYTDDEVSEQESSYTLVYPENLKPRYKTFLIENPSQKKIADGKEALSWSFTNTKPQKFEILRPFYQKIVPNIIAAPSEFEYDGYVGKMDTWNELGKWQILLNKGREALPVETKKLVQDLTGKVANDRDKVKMLYQYLQNKTRYVSIQRGIGGFQPFEASVVDKVSYGDCKALSNYMVALLKEAGLTGYYTQVYAGKTDRPVPVDFTIDYFNHIIVAVPLQKDTVWLECTSQTTPFGYLGSFTRNRYALMITDTGGVLVKTPDYSETQNQQIRNASVTIDATGNASAKVSTTFSGLQFENGGLDYYVTKQADDQKKWVQNNTAIPSFDISSFSMKMTDEEKPSANVTVDLVLNRFASVSGKRIFFSPNLMNRSTFIPEKNAERKTVIMREMAYTDLDTIRYTLPENAYPEFLPTRQSFDSRFGKYEADFVMDGNGLLYIRKVTIYGGEFPPESYQELTDFYKNINKADHVKLVLLTKT